MRRILASVAALALAATLTLAGCGSTHDNVARPTFLYNCTSCHG